MNLKYFKIKIGKNPAILALLLFCTASQALAVSADQKTKTEEPPVVTKSIEAARVISCVIRFPLDSVKFSEKQVTACLKSAKLDLVSYIHVIATASPTGSGPHNLYLSTRRAGAIEAYLNNHYPNLIVHAFGGGANPKFGKMARIFIVENQGKPQELAPGVQLAMAGPPEVIVRTTTKYITNTEYKDRPKENFDIALHSGPAKTNLSDDIYNYFAVKLSKNLNVPYVGDLSVGLRHRVLQSNDALDVNSSSLMVGRDFHLARLFGRDLYFGQTIEAGQMLTNGRSVEWGASSTLGVETQDFRFSMIATKSNYLTTLGMGLGIRM